MASKDTVIQISSGTIVRTILYVVLAVLLWYLRDIVLILLTAIVIASAMEPAVLFFRRKRFSRVVSVILMYAFVLLVFFSIIFFFIPPVLGDAARLLRELPQTLSQLNLSDVTHGLIPESSAFSSADLLNSIAQTISDTTGGVFTTLSAFFGGLTSFVLIFVFAFYFSVQETGVDDFLRVVTPLKEQAYVLNLWKRSQDKIGKWMQGQVVLGIIVGILLYLGLLILGVKYSLLLAVIAAVFELIPVFGQIMAAVPAAAIAFTSGGVTSALLVIGLYLIVQQFEAHLIYPVVVKKVVGVPPLMVILALLVGAKIAGFLGIVLSVPIAGAVQEFVADIEREKTRALAHSKEEK